MKIIIIFLLLLLIPLVSALNETEQDLYNSALLYTNNSFADHSFIEQYNLNIDVDGIPNDVEVKNSKYIKNAWLSILAVFPSVYENEYLYVSDKTKSLSKFDYEINLPANYYGSHPHTSNGDCKRTYTLTKNNYEFKHFFNNNFQGSSLLTEFNVESDGQISNYLTINAEVRTDRYRWKKYCCVRGKDGCKKYCYDCDPRATNYETDTIHLEDSRNIKLYENTPFLNIDFLDQYYDSTKGTFTANNFSNLVIKFPESFIENSLYYYDIVFEQKPFNFIFLRANTHNKSIHNNLYLSNNTFFVKNVSYCNYVIRDHFKIINGSVNVVVEKQDLAPLEVKERSFNIHLLSTIIFLVIFCYIIYSLIKSKFKKASVFLVTLISLPMVLAEDCGLTNLASCIPEKFYEYLLYIINLPLLPLLETTSALLTADPSIDIFYHLWTILRYIISFFYVFVFIYVGYTFLTSNSDPLKRAQAKEMLKNIFIMIILVQASFYIYDLTLYLSSVMNETIISMVDPHFFMLTADNIVNIGLEFILAGTYLFVLFLTVLLLVIRYIIVSFGVIFLPFAIFFYYLPPLNSYGKFFLRLLGNFIFVTFIDLLIILACSMLINVPLFENFKILVMISCFLMVDYTLFLVIKLAIKGASNNSIKQDLGQAMKYVALLV